jgi:hypothetical protein
VSLAPDPTARRKPETLAGLSANERAAVEAAKGDLGNKPNAVKLGGCGCERTSRGRKPRYTVTVARALDKIRTTGRERARRYYVTPGDQLLR